MIFESKFRDQNDMPRDKFLLDQLAFNRKANGSITKGPKQSDCLKLGTKMKRFKEWRLK